MIILVDFENTHINGMEGYEYLNENDTLVLYYSDENSVISKGMAYDLKKNGVKVKLVKLLKQHANALDMYIASTTGIYADKGELICIVSKDKGYNAVKDFWNSFIGTEILLGETIESCLLQSSNGADERIKIIKERTEKALLLDSFTCLNDPKKKSERIKNLKKLGTVNRLSFETVKEEDVALDEKETKELSNKTQNDIKPIESDENLSVSEKAKDIKNEKPSDKKEEVKSTFAVQKVHEIPKPSNDKVSYIYDPEKGVMEKIAKNIDLKDLKVNSAVDSKEIRNVNEEKNNKSVDKKEVKSNNKSVDKKEVKNNKPADKKEVKNNKPADKKDVKNNKSADKKEAKNNKPADKKDVKNNKSADKKEAKANNKPADKKDTKTNNLANKKEAKSNNKSLDNNDKKNNPKIDNTGETDNRSLDRNKQNTNSSFNAHNRVNGNQQENRSAEKNGKKNKNELHKVDYDPKKVFDEFSLKADNLHQYYITLTKHFGKDDGIVIYYGTKKMFQQLMKERKSAK